MLVAECEAGQVTRWQPCRVSDVSPNAEGCGWSVRTERGEVNCANVVIATGGLPVPKIGASDFGLRLAECLGHRIVAPRAALVPLSFAPTDWAPFVPMAGIAMPVAISTESPGKGKGSRKGQRAEFLEDLLFTHRGLSGPAVLQISSHWRAGQAIHLNLLPQLDLVAVLLQAKQNSRRQLGNELGALLTQRLAEAWLQMLAIDGSQTMPQVPDATLRQLAASLQDWMLTPSGTEGWNKAEVMAGGVDTRDLSSQTLESKLCPGLYFIGEVVDVTGWLGGYNFQWAWSSAAACAQAMAPSSPLSVTPVAPKLTR